MITFYRGCPTFWYFTSRWSVCGYCKSSSADNWWRAVSGYPISTSSARYVDLNRLKPIMAVSLYMKWDILNACTVMYSEVLCVCVHVGMCVVYMCVCGSLSSVMLSNFTMTWPCNKHMPCTCIEGKPNSLFRPLFWSLNRAAGFKLEILRS